MKVHLTNVIQDLKEPKIESSNNLKTVTKQNSEKIVDKIFDKLALIYGNAFTSALDSPEWEKIVKTQWSSAIVGMSIENIAETLKYLSGGENLLYGTYPPTFLQFVLLGNQIKRKDLPGVREAFLQATKHNYSHPIIFETAREVGIAFLCDNPNKSYPFFEEIYERNVKDFINGKIFKFHAIEKKEKYDNNGREIITKKGKFLCEITKCLAGVGDKEQSVFNKLASQAADEIRLLKRDDPRRQNKISEISEKFFQYLPIGED